QGTSATANMTVSILGGVLTKVLNAKSDSNYLLPEIKPIRRDTGELAYQVSAKIRPDAPAGKWYSDIWLTTNNPALTRIRVPVTIEIEAPPAVSPRTLAVGRIKAGSQSDREITLRGVQPFRITGIDGTDDQVRIKDSGAEAKAVHVLTVIVNPTSPGP